MTGKLTVIGSGSGKAENITLHAMEKIKQADVVLLRTARMPLASLLQQKEINFIALDFCYEKAEDFEILNILIYEQLSSYKGNTCYIVYGSAIDDLTVATCVKNAEADGIPCEIVPGIALADTVAATFRAPAGYSTYTALEGISRRMDVRSNQIITCIDSPLLASELKCKLLEYYDAEIEVQYYIENEQGLGSCCKMPLFELDRQSVYNHTASIYLKALSLEEAARYDYFHLTEIVDRLRSKNGCPWDREQTHKSLTSNLLEEAYEVIDTINEDEMDKLYDELGDVLLQVVFHAQIAKEHGDFNELDVTNAICAKMIHRHPHIFGNVIAHSSEQVLNNWEMIKREEKQLKTHAEVMQDVPKALPALARAQKIQQKAAKAGFDWADFMEAFEKLPEEFAELKEAFIANNTESIHEEIGDLLFTVVNIARHANVQTELALYQSTEKFIKRFEQMEQQILADNKVLTDMSLSDMDIYWDRAKKSLKSR